MTFVPIETVAPVSLEITQIPAPQSAFISPTKPNPQDYKDAIRTSLRASTLDAVFAAVFGVATGGILLSNFLLELGASPVVFGMLSSIPMLVNLVQPLGALLSERSSSRFQYSLKTHGIARLLWLILGFSIITSPWIGINSQQLILLTLLVVLFSGLLGGLGSASWLSWLATIVPRKLRGRYFGIRNSASSLTNLLCVPLAGLAVSHWYGGTLQGYGIILFAAIACGIISICCQYFQTDMNPALQNSSLVKYQQTSESAETVTVTEITSPPNDLASIGSNWNFLRFLLYFGFWTLAFNISAPFFNFYMLDKLHLDVSCVTLYGSLQAGASMLLIVLWGKLADKIGNRRILMMIGSLVALTPLLWLGVSANSWNIWLWLPLLHIFTGGTLAAIDLCNNNLQLAIAPLKNQSIYFAIASAVAGFSGALGTTIGGFIAEFAGQGALLGLFALSSLCRLAAILPLIFVEE
ncbi:MULTISPECIES: MFS transporter [Calothrix]|uniref:MFS transporter n=2 Tax=Calothrix TaxID=1186 RepID=A0ABR8AF78_9CYAN|nr:MULTISPECIES: MFS transporter [Calothrix]MBD2198695.1 MFS transporter [Calothrix parietina FACHB-288]MBD2228704.1 MFS transporter [Calothrix anomala FACHB-343]